MLRSFLSNHPQRYYESDKGDNPAGSETGNDPVITEKTFTQTEVNVFLKADRERHERKAKELAEKAKTEAEQKALLEQGEFKTLAEQRASELATTKLELEAAKAHEETANKYKKALQLRLAEDKKSLPAGIVAILDQLDEIKQMEWLADPKNLEVLKAPAESSTRTHGTPPRNGSNAARNTTAPVRQSSDDDPRPRFNLG